MDEKKIEALGHMAELVSQVKGKMELAAWIGSTVDLQEEDGINMKYLQMVANETSELHQKLQARYRAEFIDRLTVSK